MQRVLDSAIGLPSRPVSALWMLVFLIPADVSRSFTVALPWLYRRPASTDRCLNPSGARRAVVDQDRPGNGISADHRPPAVRDVNCAPHVASSGLALSRP